MDGLVTRDVLKLWDTEIRAPNWKRLICVCPRRRFFLRINTRPFWPPHTRLRQADCADFLEWDSYVELRGLIRIPISEFREAIARPGNPIGRISDQIARQIAFAAQQAPTISDEQRGIIWEKLVGSV